MPPNNEDQPEREDNSIPVFEAPDIDEISPQISERDYEYLQQLPPEFKPVKSMLFELSKIRQGLALLGKNQEDTNRYMRALELSVKSLKNDQTTTISWPKFIRFSARFVALAVAAAVLAAVGKSWVEGWWAK